MIAVRASINLAGLHRGQEAEVDPNDPEIAALIAAGYLVPDAEGKKVVAPPAGNADGLPDVDVDAPSPEASETDAAASGVL